MDSGSVLVTGGTGFLGSHLVRRLVQRGSEIHVFARPASELRRIEDVLSRVTIWRGDLADCDSLRQCIEASRPGVVFHLAGDTAVRWLDPDLANVDRSIDTNLKGTLNVLKELHRTRSPVRSFVRTGGLEEYGRGLYPYDEQQRENPVSPYSAAQAATTHYCQMLQPTLRFPVVTLRLALVYGPFQSDSFFIPSLITHCLKDLPFVMSSGWQGRDLVFVDDVVDALISASTSRLRGEVINIGSGDDYRMGDVADLIRRISGSATRLKIGALAPRSSEIQHLVCRTEKARRLLNWSPFTTLEQGLTRTIEWYRERRTELQELGRR